MGLDADSEDGEMGIEVNFGAVSEIEGDAGGDGNSGDGKDGTTGTTSTSVLKTPATVMAMVTAAKLAEWG